MNAKSHCCSEHADSLMFASSTDRSKESEECANEDQTDENSSRTHTCAERASIAAASRMPVYLILASIGGE